MFDDYNETFFSLLLGSRAKLSWDIRYKIALGSAAGLHYLHEGCQRRIIHRDIKSANILLTEDFEAQVSGSSHFILSPESLILSVNHGFCLNNRNIEHLKMKY